MKKNKMPNNINEEDIMKSLRNSSKGAIPSAEFKKELEGKLFEDKQSFFEQLVNSFKKERVAYLSSFMTFTILLGATWMFLSKDEPVVQTIIENNESYMSDSPYLSQNGIDPETANVINTFKDESGDSFFGLFDGESSRSESVEIVYKDSSDVSFSMPSPSPSKSYGLDDYIMPEQTSLSGGSVNDNKDFFEFLQYLKDQQFEDEIDDLFAERYLIKVNDENGDNFPFVDMDIVDESENIYRLHTYSNGEIYFYPNAYQYGDQQQQVSNKYSVIIGSEVYTFSSDDNIWSIELDMEKQASNETTLDLVFTIDTTGSMSDQINKLKETMGSISKDINNEYPNVTIRYGLVAYRDISDQYLTEVYDFTTDLDEYQEYLDELSAAGGGDYEEDMNSALKDTIEDLDWSDDEGSLKLVFLIADAPPHMDYDQQYTYETAMFRSLELGIKIFPIASSGLDNSHGELILRKVAAVTNAEYMFITNSSGGTDYHVGDDQFQVSNLDGLVLDVISKEIDAL